MQLMKIIFSSSFLRKGFLWEWTRNTFTGSYKLSACIIINWHVDIKFGVAKKSSQILRESAYAMEYLLSGCFVVVFSGKMELESFGLSTGKTQEPKEKHHKKFYLTSSSRTCALSNLSFCQTYYKSSRTLIILIIFKPK